MARLGDADRRREGGRAGRGVAVAGRWHRALCSRPSSGRTKSIPPDGITDPVPRPTLPRVTGLRTLQAGNRNGGAYGQSTLRWPRPGKHVH